MKGSGDREHNLTFRMSYGRGHDLIASMLSFTKFFIRLRNIITHGVLHLGVTF